MIRGLKLTAYQKTILEHLMGGCEIEAHLVDNRWKFFLCNGRQEEPIKYSAWKRLRKLELLKLQFRNNNYKRWK